MPLGPYIIRSVPEALLPSKCAATKRKAERANRLNRTALALTEAIDHGDTDPCSVRGCNQLAASVRARQRGQVGLRSDREPRR